MVYPGFMGNPDFRKAFWLLLKKSEETQGSNFGGLTIVTPWSKNDYLMTQPSKQNLAVEENLDVASFQKNESLDVERT